jgi:hypothetical protein
MQSLHKGCGVTTYRRDHVPASIYFAETTGQFLIKFGTGV